MIIPARNLAIPLQPGLGWCCDVALTAPSVVTLYEAGRSEEHVQAIGITPDNTPALAARSDPDRE